MKNRKKIIKQSKQMKKLKGIRTGIKIKGKLIIKK